ncbi:MAG: hypothetical protein ACXIT4_11765 [Erythrobacter sp.]
MANSISDDVTIAGRELLGPANQSLDYAADGLLKFSAEASDALADTSRSAAKMTEQAGVRAADATEYVSRLLADELKRHPAATFAAILGAVAAVTGIVIASKRIGRRRAE